MADAPESIPTLSEAKDFLRVDIDDDDTLIQTLIYAAAESVADFLDGPLPEVAAVKAAILLRVASLYEHRTETVERPLSDNPVFERLLWPYRELSA